MAAGRWVAPAAGGFFVRGNRGCSRYCATAGAACAAWVERVEPVIGTFCLFCGLTFAAPGRRSSLTCCVSIHVCRPRRGLSHRSGGRSPAGWFVALAAGPPPTTMRTARCLRAVCGLYCRCEVRVRSRHEHVLPQGDVKTFPSRTPTLGLPLQGRPLDVVASQGTHATPGVCGSQRVVDDYHASAVIAATWFAALAAAAQIRRHARPARPGCAPARTAPEHRHGGHFIGYLLPLSNTAGTGLERVAAGAVQARTRGRLKRRAGATIACSYGPRQCEPPLARTLRTDPLHRTDPPHRSAVPPFRPRNFGTATRCVPCRPC